MSEYYWMILAFLGFIVFGFLSKGMPKKKYSYSRQYKRKNNKSYRRIQNEKKGRLFEGFIITRFDNTYYRLIDWRSDKFIENWGGAESCRWPDLVMENIASGRRIAIECKYRSNGDHYGRITWAYPQQIENYMQYEMREGIPVIIAIGLGGKPDNPDAVYLIPLKKLPYSKITLASIKKYKSNQKVRTFDFD